MRGSLRLARVTSTLSKSSVTITPFSKSSRPQKAILFKIYLSPRQTFSSTSPRHVKFTLPDELARSIPRDSKQRRVDTNIPLPSAELSYWKQVARDKEEKPYQRFSTAQPTKQHISFQKIESPELVSPTALPASPVHITESLKPLEDCYTFPATTAEDWRAVEAFIDQDAAMRTKEAVEEEVGTPLTKQDVAIVNDLSSTASTTQMPPALSATTTLPKPKNTHTVNTPTCLNRKFSTSVPNNWAVINTWIREAATQTAMKRRTGLGEDISAALAPLTREELAELASALGQATPPTPQSTMEESAKIPDLPPLLPPQPRNIHTVNPTLDGQFSTSETIKIGQMTIKVLEDGSRTENKMSAVLITIPPETRGAPIKFNEAHDEGFLVVKGKVRFTTGRYLDADRTTAEEKAESPENKGAKAMVDAEAAVHVADVGATSTSGDLLVPNKDMLEEILHAGARPVNVNHVMSSSEMDNEGISVDVDVKWGGWVTVPRGARYTFSNPFEEEAEMLNTFTPGGDLEEMRRMSDEGRIPKTGEGRGGNFVHKRTKSVDDGGS